MVPLHPSSTLLYPKVAGEYKHHPSNGFLFAIAPPIWMELSLLYILWSFIFHNHIERKSVGKKASKKFWWNVFGCKIHIKDFSNAKKILEFDTGRGREKKKRRKLKQVLLYAQMGISRILFFIFCAFGCQKT